MLVAWGISYREVAGLPAEEAEMRSDNLRLTGPRWTTRLGAWAARWAMKTDRWFVEEDVDSVRRNRSPPYLPDVKIWIFHGHFHGTFSARMSRLIQSKLLST